MPNNRDTKPVLRGTALIRRARWLERKITEGARPGSGYDTAEYAELLWAFEKLGISFVAADQLQPEPEPPRRKPATRDLAPDNGTALDEPPIRPVRSDDWVPGEPRHGSRHVPGGF